MNLLEMKNIKKEFNGQSVLKDISLQVKEGEIVSIIRPFRFREINSFKVCYHADRH